MPMFLTPSVAFTLIYWKKREYFFGFDFCKFFFQDEVHQPHPLIRAHGQGHSSSSWRAERAGDERFD